MYNLNTMGSKLGVLSKYYNSYKFTYHVDTYANIVDAMLASITHTCEASHVCTLNIILEVK